MYFNHAFRKSYLLGANGITTGALTLPTTGTTANLIPGQIGVFGASNYAALTAGANVPFLLAQGSYFTNDKIGPVHGGYSESVKSKVINPKYINRVFKVLSKTAQNQVVNIGVCNTMCNTTYRLRLDVKGSPALRFLQHNLYSTLDAFTGCCVDPKTPVAVDPTIVAIQWAQQINADLILNPFIVATVQDHNGVVVPPANWATYIPAFDPATELAEQAHVIITVAYIDTKFGNCTFTPTDFYELEPLFVYASMVDEDGDPCTNNCWSFSETTPARQASGVGETILRSLILDGRYRQEHFPDSGAVEHLRMREIEQNPGLATVNRNGFYDQVQILHSVPRYNNPTGTFDNDQYLLVVNVPAGTVTTALTTFITASAAAAGNPVVLENI